MRVTYNIFVIHLKEVFIECPQQNHQENVSLVSHTCQAFFILSVTYFYLYVKKEAKSCFTVIPLWFCKFIKISLHISLGIGNFPRS